MITARLLALVLLGVSVGFPAWADKFDELEKKRAADTIADPFANRKVSCTALMGKGIELKERWEFFGATKAYTQNLAGRVTRSGTYEVADGKVLKLSQEKSMVGTSSTVSEEKIDLQYKVSKTGYEYIFEKTKRDGSKLELLYKCKYLN